VAVASCYPVGMQHGQLPHGVELQRVTPEFDADTVPAGLLRAHRIAAGVWGLLRVTAGSVRFVFEDGSPEPVDLDAATRW
jgi:cupin 2 domain-containing protein